VGENFWEQRRQNRLDRNQQPASTNQFLNRNSCCPNSCTIYNSATIGREGPPLVRPRPTSLHQPFFCMLCEYSSTNAELTSSTISARARRDSHLYELSFVPERRTQERSRDAECTRLLLPPCRLKDDTHNSIRGPRGTATLCTRSAGTAARANPCGPGISLGQRYGVISSQILCCPGVLSTRSKEPCHGDSVSRRMVAFITLRIMLTL